MNKAKQYTDLGFKWGIIQFIVSAAIFYVSYFVDMKFALSTVMWFTIPISITLMVIQGIQARKIDGGGLTYGDAFKTLFIAVTVSAALFLTSNYVVKAYIAPDKAEEEKIVRLEQTAKQMENWGMDEETIDKAIEKMEAKDARPTLLDTLIGFLGAVIINTLFVMVIAIFIKKKKKEEDVFITEETT